MKLPRDVGGKAVADALKVYGYEVTRQSGSHIRLTRRDPRRGDHHITIPAHTGLKTGTLAGIVREVGSHLGKGRNEVLEDLDL